MTAVKTIELAHGWHWKQRSSSTTDILAELDGPSVEEPASVDVGATAGWRETQAYPSEVHVELLKNGLIPDPYKGFNEHSVQWIGEAEWLYKCHFAFEAEGANAHAALELLGLDTVCDVYLNGAKILETDNQFRTYTVPVELSALRKSNILLLHFKSAAQSARALEQKYGKVRAGSTNLGDPSRVYLRKAQYDWRWDWGPELMTSGPYRPIILRVYTARIAEVHAKAVVSDDLQPSLELDVELSGTISGAFKSLRVTLSDSEGKQIEAQDVPLASDGKSSLKDAVKWLLDGKVKLWWPVGYGAQVLYTVSVSLVGNGEEIFDSQTKRVGFRSVQLVQEPLTEPDQYGTGTTFLFEVNGVRMFMGGSNWIPADNFLTTISAERYKAWLTLLRDGNQNMVRIWGGGIYEPDVFFDICDELGLLVWQDFQFACGVYPAHDEFVASVRKEAEDNVKRIRHHPSLAILCGNNEDYQMVHQWNDVPNLPAVKIYEEVLPEVVDALTYPPLPYHRGSPYGGKGWDTADPTVGDVHQWDIWGGKEYPWQSYDRLGGRFVSEFGIPSMPEMRTIKYWADGAPEKEMYAQSALMAQHCRAGGFERRFAIVTDDDFKISDDLETTVYNRQLMQAEAVGYAYQVWRREWRGKGKQYTGGVLVWQANDCWPVTSWAIADYFLRPKPVYYTIARHLAAISVGTYRTVIKNRANDRPRQFYEFGAFQSRDATIDIWGTNSSLSAVPATLELHCVDLLSPWTHTEMHAVTLLPNQATELLSIRVPAPPKDGLTPPTGYADWTTSHSVVVGVRLRDAQAGDVLARHADWPQPYRYLDLPDPALKVVVDEKQGTISVSAERPAKGVVLRALGESEVKWSDNNLDVMPGDTRVLEVVGLAGHKLEVAYLGKEKASEIS
ncbi:glycoside hydrolase family 2 protein [Auriscalpium vulgare]|uniref:Glycoside hydrolase family 2 protein n=1 Tax=Auriscalpium vulgare TaxID=40419 RepID=A0ACB8SBA7_9AGAM|nr:glycoside hydrolase family 2 protein [Auriscalpium vulgare]